MKTTGVSDIPKFGLLDFLGHPSLDGQMSSILALGQTGELGSRSSSGGREEVAGSGVGEVLEERGEGTQPRHHPSLEVVPDWGWQAGQVD